MKRCERYFYGEDNSQFGDLYLPQRNQELLSVIVLIHGGYWKQSHSLDSYLTYSLIPPLVRRGFAVWNIEYRRMEAEGENKAASWPAVFTDVASAVDSLKDLSVKHSLNLNKIYSIGHSAGGCLALWAAYRRNIHHCSELYTASPVRIYKAMSIAGVISLTHGDDLCQPQQIERLIGGTYSDMFHRYCNSDPAAVYDSKVPTFIYHGGADETVSPSQIEHFKSLSGARQLQIMFEKDADHFSMLPESESFQVDHYHSLLHFIDQVIDS